MRDFKFRAWHKEAKEMFCEDVLGDCFRWKAEGQSVVIMQSVGPKDKKGKDIFENDIVIVPDGYAGDRWQKETVSLVEWEFDQFVLDSHVMQDFCWDELKVIGNKFENPELLLQEN